MCVCVCVCFILPVAFVLAGMTPESFPDMTKCLSIERCVAFVV